MDRLKSTISAFLESPRPVKRLVSLIYDAMAIAFCIYAAFYISTNVLLLSEPRIFFVTAITSISSMLLFAKIGFYRAILRYMGLKAIFRIALGVAFSTLMFSISSLYLGLPFTAITLFLYLSFCFLAIGGSRLLTITIIRSEYKQPKLPIAIYGAGESGRELARALSQSHEYRVAAYIDDDPEVYHTEIDGVEVFSSNSIAQIIKQHSIKEILLAMPSENHATRSEVLSRLEPYPVKIKTIASMDEIVSGKVQIEQLREIEIEDLLGRDSVEPDQNLLESCINGKVVMVTGAGGTIGSELCRQIVTLKPTILLLYELSEFALYTIERELQTICRKSQFDLQIIPLLGSVQHKGRLVCAMQQYQVNTVYHAAAYKHVPIVEHNVVEGVRNNVFGTWYTAEAAAETGVERFVLVSTDKAVRPTNVMGASKRLAELVLQAITDRGERTKFMMVRFGNVLGSSGSVVPLFREQIKAGGPVTVTHKEIIRYFMTIPEAAQLVIQAGAMGEGGDVFVLDMGEQVKIAELAERMIHLMGYSIDSSDKPNGDIEINYSGLRPGEKLYEELLVGENVVGTTHAKIMTADEEFLSWTDIQKALIILNELCEDMDCEGIVQLLLRIPTGYNPQHKVCDLLWDANRDKNNVLRFKTSS